MNSQNNTILFVREVPWNSFFPISTRKLAAEFADDGWNVIWFTTPMMPWHWIKPRSGSQAVAGSQENKGVFYGENIFSYVPKTLLPFSKRSPLDQPILAHYMWSACWPPLKRVLRRAAVPEPDILFLAHWSAGGIQRLFPGRPVIFHVTDNYEHYPTVPKAAARHLQQQNYAAADHIIVTAPSLNTLLQDEYTVPASKITTVIHGVDLEKYTADHPLPEKLAPIKPPRIVTIGNTSKLDYPILKALAARYRDYSWVILGPGCPELEQAAQEHPNIYALGGINPDEVPAYLQACDLGLILVGKRFRDAGQDMFPMKLFEYAAAGLPVISTPLPVYNTIDVPLWLVDTPESAITAVEEALSRQKTVAGTMRAFANAHTWNAKYQEVLSIIRPLLNQ